MARGDDVAVHRVEDDDRVLVHAHRRRGVDPVAVPPCLSEAGVDFLRVVAALAADEHIHSPERVDVLRLGDGRRVAADVRPARPDLRRRKKLWFDARKVLLGDHPLDEHRPDHPRHPTNPTRIPSS